MNKSKVISVRKIWLTTDEAMKYTGWSRDYLKTLRNNGKLNFSKPFGEKMTMYRVDDIDRLIERGFMWKHATAPSRVATSMQ